MGYGQVSPVRKMVSPIPFAGATIFVSVKTVYVAADEIHASQIA